jgi:membrane fusion protein, multidrug efflux system
MFFKFTNSVKNTYHKKAFMKLLLRIVLFLAFVASLAFIKYKYFPKNELQSGPPAAASGGNRGAAAPTMGVMGYVIRPERLENKIFATGSIIASEVVDLKPEVAGKIVQLNIQEGKSVTKGELLIKLNDIDLQAQMKKLQAQLSLTEQSEQRLRKLLEVKGISQDEYDIVTNQMNNIKADMEFTQAQIAKTELRAPFSGLIGLRSISLGSFVNATSQIATILVLNPVRVDFTVPEKYSNQVRLGDNISFSTEGATETYNGKVTAIDNQIDPVTRTLKIRATASNPNYRLRAGAFVKVNFNLKEIDNALMIPTEAIIPILKGQQVYIAKNGKAVPVNIEVGMRTDTKIQILGGVQLGDTVVTSGLMGMRPNSSIKFTTVK